MVNHTMYSDDEDSQEDQYVNYKQKYRELKKNLRYLIYENECFQDELRKAQHNFVSISRDKSFLLDRILKYEKPQGPSSDSEATESSDEDEEAKMPTAASHFFSQRKKITKRKKSEAEMHNGNSSISSSESLHHMNAKQVPMKPMPGKAVSGKGNVMMKKPKKPIAARKPPVKKEAPQKGNSERNVMNPQVIKNYEIDNMQVVNEEQVNATETELPNSITEYKGVEYEFSTISGSEGHMTREEVERHLESRRFSPELNTTATVPAELFSHEPDPESEFEDGEICEFIQLEEDGASADMILE
ncbi:UNVERIFIED_CONTAM: hypothetical protein PYX00_005439 [Menopon gallinae]|uniref:INO80 complex subunit E N-terminal domain-containing protein n=1 Tax=Menopon gallinae TaxID=328185 RepID=A0AAW2HRH1_9NEOP